MRDDFGYFMRLHVVELARYLPHFLNGGTFGDALKTLSAEHELYRLRLVEFARELFLDGAAWSMPDWLEFVGLKSSGDLETDRAAVKAKLLGAETMTVANSNRLINLFTQKKNSYVLEGAEPNVLEIILQEYPNSLSEMEAALLELMPAHLQMKMKLLREDSEEFFTGGAIHERGVVEIKGDRSIRFGLLAHETGTISIGYEQVPPFAGLISHEHGIVAIEGDQSRHFGAAVHEKGTITIKAFEEAIPAGDKLRIYFHFESWDKYITIDNPRSDLTTRDVEELGAYATANNLLRNGAGEPIKRICKVEVISGDEITTIYI